ncbi:deoxyribose-phosphate aldolase [Clostridium sp. AM58-1XD]|nr:deoxyribose-phosphate aldolase [Clostridium sp. AM58-1XD]
MRQISEGNGRNPKGGWIRLKYLKLPEDEKLVKEVISKIDYSNALVPNCTDELVVRTCEEALQYGFAAVAVFPSCVKEVAKRLEGSAVHSQVAVGFPMGNHMTKTKLTEAEIALNEGVKEVDMVMNLHRFFSKDYSYVEEELRQMVELAAGYGVTVKLIIETGYLDDEQKLKAGQIAVSAGAAFVKTCTGFGPGRATVHDVGLLLSRYGDKIKVKASGGIASLDDAAGFISMGAGRSAGRHNIIDQLEKMGYRP